MKNSNEMLLAWHAGLEINPPPDKPQSSISFSEALWMARKGKHVDLARGFLEVSNILQKVNIDINGPRPSVSNDGKTAIPRGLVASVASIEASLAETAIITKSKDVQKLVWRFAYLWQSIVAGDVDDLEDDLHCDEMARFSW